MKRRYWTRAPIELIVTASEILVTCPKFEPCAVSIHVEDSGVLVRFSSFRGETPLTEAIQALAFQAPEFGIACSNQPANGLPGVTV